MAMNLTATPAIATLAPLRPDHADELLQGFLNIDGSQNVVNARLTQQELQAYSQRQFFVADPNRNVAAYLNQNFSKIAGLDGDASSISANDLVQLKQGLPVPTSPPPVSYPPVNNQPQQQLFSLMFQMMQMLLQMFNSFLGR